MLKILLVKTSSLGDLIHTMPAISDLQRCLPDAELHWLVEDSFAAIPQWHPFVKKIHLCSTRRWRKSLFSQVTRQQMQALKKQLQDEQFDLVIDAQGLIKSSLMVRWLSCEKHGYDRHSIREKLASVVYTDKHAVSRSLNAIERVRLLFASVFHYSLNAVEQSFGMHIEAPAGVERLSVKPYVIFLHSTVWNSKIWPMEYWKELATRFTDSGYSVFLPWGNDDEKIRAQCIAEYAGAIVLDKLPLTHLAWHLQNAALVVGSDTGLTHVAGALSTPTIGIYGPTSTALTGVQGAHVKNLSSSLACSPCLQRECPLITEGQIIPCYKSIDSGNVFRAATELLNA